MLVTIRLDADPRQLVRHCILCDADEGQPVFDYTCGFMKDVRGSTPESLDQNMFTKGRRRQAYVLEKPAG